MDPVHPRRRLLHSVSTDPPSCFGLRKGSTFHSPTSPRSPENDPILSVPSLPRRSPTCSKQLEATIAAGDGRIAQILGAVDRTLAGLESFSSDSQETLVVAESEPVPRFMVDVDAHDEDVMDIDARTRLTTTHARKHHASDSGIGSTETSEPSIMDDDACVKDGVMDRAAAAARSVALNENSVQSGINGNSAMAVAAGSSTQHALSEYACRQIQKHIIVPILQEEKLKNFHPLVGGLPYRVASKEITCLRDLEKVLLWLAPKWSISKASFLHFCETSIQCIHTTVDYLNESDQRRPTDRPYTNGYFLDLVEQVRQYAAMLASSRARTPPDNTNSTRDERLSLMGGLSQTGRPAELVRTNNGKSISLRTGEEVAMEDYKPGSKRAVDGESEEDILRSMARRKKSAGQSAKEEQKCRECEKVFKRPCDLTKHEKTHSRPWKCTEANCKYHEYGWPTEKERDRHMNDKHSAAPAMFKCLYNPCPYESKRESNCKQHMEKAHGWTYVRSKNNGKNSKRTVTGQAPPTPQMSTPGSHAFSAATPDMSDVLSHSEMQDDQHDDQFTVPEYHPTFNNFPQESSTFSEIFGPIDNNFTWNDLSETNIAQTSAGLADSHRASWDSSIASSSILQSNFDDHQSLFGNNFDWSNMNHDLASLNVQLATPATSIDHQPAHAFDCKSSMSLEQSPQSVSHPSLSPGAHGDAMLYTPFSAPSNDVHVDEGFDEFTQDLVPRPNRDFSLFDNGPMTNLNGSLFEDLSCLGTGTAPWPAKPTDLIHQLGMSGDLLRMEE